MHRLWRILVVTGLAASVSGCLVNVRQVDDPAPAFAKAHAEAASVQGTGKPGSLNVLVYDPTDHALVRVSAPLWLVRKAGDIAIGDEEGDEGKQFARLCLRPENLEKAGRGVVVEVDEEQGDHVLVWLR
jgi:hypothetical protein